ncbi:unnamed protein product, partial [Sphacelaria rigidula]
AQVYLLAYNLACALGWNVAIQKIGGAFVEGGRIEDAVNDAVDIIVVLQLVSTLEFVHGCVGLVSFPCNTTTSLIHKMRRWCKLLHRAWNVRTS